MQPLVGLFWCSFDVQWWLDGKTIDSYMPAVAVVSNEPERLKGKQGSAGHSRRGQHRPDIGDAYTRMQCATGLVLCTLGGI